jgi:hypothetical protein
VRDGMAGAGSFGLLNLALDMRKAGEV